MLLEAHKGVSTEFPENTLPALMAAARQGYHMAELDLSVTRDDQIVVLHDATINRTARHSDGSPLTSPVPIGSISYQEALAYDFGLAFGPEFAGTRLPLFTQVLDLSRQQKLPLKIDNKFQTFSPAHQQLLFQLVEASGAPVEFTCKDLIGIRQMLERFPHGRLHYDGPLDPASLEALSRLLPREQLTIWVPYPCKNTWWALPERANPALCRRVQAHGRLGIWILSDLADARAAQALGADILETTGAIKPWELSGAPH